MVSEGASYISSSFMADPRIAYLAYIRRGNLSRVITPWGSSRTCARQYKSERRDGSGCGRTDSKNSWKSFTSIGLLMLWLLDIIIEQVEYVY